MAKYPSFAGGLSAGLEAGLNRQDTRMQQTNQAALKRFQMSQGMLEQGLNTILKIKEAGGTVPPEMEQMVAQLAKQVDGLSEGLGMPDSGMYGQSTSALIGMPGPKKARGEPVAIYDSGGNVIGYEEAGTDALHQALQPEATADPDDPGGLSIASRSYLKGDLPADDRTEKMKNAEAYAAATGVSIAEAYKHLFPGEKPTDSRTKDQQDFEYYQSLPKDTPEQIEAANRFAKSVNLDLTEDKGTELQQNMAFWSKEIEPLPDDDPRKIAWEKKLGIGNDDPAKIELFKAYQNLPPEQQAAYDNFYKSDAKDSRTALIKNFEFLDSIKDPEQKAFFTSLLQPDPSAPSIVREWAIVSSWSPEKQAQYMEYRKQIATMTAQQQMTILDRIFGLKQDNPGTGDSILNKVITEADAANPSASDQGLGTQSNPIPITDDSDATLDQHKGKYVLFNGQIYLVPK